MEIDEGKAMVAYYGSGLDKVMSFAEFKRRYGHLFRKKQEGKKHGNS